MNENECIRLAKIVQTVPAAYPGGLSAYTEAIEELRGVEECIALGLSRTLSQATFSEFRGYLLAAYYHPSKLQTGALCNALALRSTDVSPEDVVEVLEVVQDPASVPYIIEALRWQPEWDEFHHFARKCIWALAAIGTHEAVQALRDAAAVGPLEVREAASFELEQLGQPTTE